MEWSYIHLKTLIKFQLRYSRLYLLNTQTTTLYDEKSLPIDTTFSYVFEYGQSRNS